MEANDNGQRSEAADVTLGCINKLIEDRKKASRAPIGPGSALPEVIKLAESLKEGVPNVDQPCVSMDCLVENFSRNRDIEPVLNLLSSTRKVKHGQMSQYLWHNFLQRASVGHFNPPDAPSTSSLTKEKSSTAIKYFESAPGDAWVKFEDLPIFANRETPLKEEVEAEDMEVEESSMSQTVLSQVWEEDESMKISIAEFLEQCKNAEGDLGEDFVVKLCAQTESNLSALFASCCDSPSVVMLLSNSVSKHVELVGPFCDKVLFTLCQKDELDGQLLAKVCSISIAFPTIVASRFIAPLAREPGLKGTAVKVIRLCKKDEVNQAVLSSLLNSVDWVAAKDDLELLQCLLGCSLSKNPLAVQLLCQMFANAEAGLKDNNDFAKLLLQTIKTLKGELTDQCKALLKTAIAAIKSPLRTLMEKQLSS